MLHSNERDHHDHGISRPGYPGGRASGLPTKAEVRELADQVVSALVARPFNLEGIDRILAQARADVQFEIQRMGRGRRR